MSFNTLYCLYCDYWEGNTVHHTEVAQAIITYAKDAGIPAADVLAQLGPWVPIPF